MSVYPRNKTNELAGVLLLAASLLLFLSLISYDALDPSQSVAARHSPGNLIGKVGAWTADQLYQSLGFPALLLPLPILLVGYKKVRTRKIEYPWAKLSAFFCILFSLSTGMSLLAIPVPGPTNFTAGGLVGIFFSRQLLYYLNPAGSLIAVATLLVLSLLVATRFSIEAAVERVGARSWNPWKPVLERLRVWRMNREDRRELARIRKGKEPVKTWKPPLPSDELPFEPPVRRGDGGGAGIALEPAVSAMQPARHEGERSPAAEPVTTATPAARIFRIPALEFLQESTVENRIDEQELIERAQKLTTKCAEFDVTGRVLQIHPGPVVTTFEFKPDPGVKYSRITNLADDLCLAMKAESIRIDRIPGKNTVGIEVPNRKRQVIYLRSILSSPAYRESSSKLTLGLGQLINGETYVTELSRMPHLLIAGSTGTGKSVSLNCLVCSILYKATPDEVRFIMVDPKRLELGLYQDIPHLLTPIVTDPKKAANALNWAVHEMEQRYRMLAQMGVRNIEQYNRTIQEQGDEALVDRLEHEPEALPFIVIIVDELADLMMTAGKDVENALTRLAQMARAVGIHLILATQRPSVDVLTGLIKANFPCRISFRVSSKVDSRTILDSNGAEQLLGLGDMLFLPPGTSRFVRIHGAFLSEKEIGRITRFLREQAEPEYREEILEGEDDEDETALVDVGDMEDDLYDEATRFVVETGRASTSLLQRRLRIGYGRAARLLDMMEHEGLVGPSEGSKPRELRVPSNYFDEMKGG